MLVCALSSFLLRPLIVFAETGIPDIHVVKNAQCGCCDSWVEILSKKRFKVTTENLSRDLLTKFKIKSGVPKEE